MKNNCKPPALPMGPSGITWRLRAHFDNIKQNWIRDGFVVLPGIFKADQIARYNAIVSKVRSEVDDGKDEQGYGDRIGQLHQKKTDLLELASSPKVLDFLKWALGDDPLLMGSLQFQKGTQQEAHIDAIFFWPEPAYSMAGLWVALEDIHEDAGPLFYLPGSHKWPFYRSEDVVRSRPELAARRIAARNGELSVAEHGAVLGEIGNAWTEDFIKLEREYQKTRVPICLRAGDVVVWHSLLAHGGSPRNDPTRSRVSAVFHYFGKQSKLFTNEQFMLYDNAQLIQQASATPEVCHHNGIDFMRFPNFVTYSDGKEILHPI